MAVQVRGGAQCPQALALHRVLWRIICRVTRAACRYPATLMFYSNAAADTSRLRGRPNFYMSTRQQALQAFATFKSLALLHSSSSGGGGDGGH
jgi:hypothetical protein